jgi:hypothetical protein
MRVCASDFGSEKCRCVRIIHPSMNDFERKAALEMVQEEALDFAQDYFMSFDLPSAPTVYFLGMEGFENVKVPFDKVSGTFRFGLKFSTASNHTVDLEFPFPYCRGDLLTPTIAIYAKKKFIISQDSLDGIIARFNSIRPKLSNPLQPSMRVDHTQNVERPIFCAPNDPSGWSDLISERYM